MSSLPPENYGSNSSHPAGNVWRDLLCCVDSCIAVVKKLVESFSGVGGGFVLVIPPLHRPTDLGGVNQQLADLPLSHFRDVMHVDVTQDGVVLLPAQETSRLWGRRPWCWRRGPSTSSRSTSRWGGRVIYWTWQGWIVVAEHIKSFDRA